MCIKCLFFFPRGAFSLGNPSGGRFFNPLDLRIKAIANTNVVHWGGRTLALHEVSHVLPAGTYLLLLLGFLVLRCQPNCQHPVFRGPKHRCEQGADPMLP